MSLTSLYWCSVSVLAHLTNDMASVLVWLSRSLSLHKGSENRNQAGKKRKTDVEVLNEWDGINEMNGKEGRGREERKKGYQYVSNLMPTRLH